MTNYITLIYDKRIIQDKYKLTKGFSKYYINIVQKSDGSKLVKLGVSRNLYGNAKSINDILWSYKGHPSILANKDMVSLVNLENFNVNTDVKKNSWY